MTRTDMQDDLDPRCVWMVTEADTKREDERRCMKPARYRYLKRIEASNRLPSVELYTMCGSHASPRNRERAVEMGYIVQEIAPREA